MLYPLKFKPILKQTIWGGDKLAYKSNDPKVKESIGESWEISGVQDNISVVSYLDVPLTSIRIEIESICDAMLNLLAAKMDNQYYRSRQVISVPCNLVKRQSVKKL